jgi:hypothetical protein
MPAPTANQAEQYIPGSSSIVDIFRELHGGYYSNLVTFGYQVPNQE